MATVPDAPRATCPNTGVAVPECSCRVCHEEQLRRFKPELLEPALRAVATAGRGRPVVDSGPERLAA